MTNKIYAVLVVLSFGLIFSVAGRADDWGSNSGRNSLGGTLGSNQGYQQPNIGYSQPRPLYEAPREQPVYQQPRQESGLFREQREVNRGYPIYQDHHRKNYY